MQGRYINIVNPGMNQFLTLCELRLNGHQSKNPPRPAGNTLQNIIGDRSGVSSYLFLYVEKVPIYVN